MNFKDFLSTFDSYLEYENLFSSYYYGYVNNVFVEKKLLYPILIYHTDALNHSILDNSITVLKFNFFVFDKLKTDNSNVIDVQDDLLKKLVKIQSYLKRKFFATNFTLTAVSDEAYSEKITGWIMECLIKLDTSDSVCIDYKPRYLVDNISKYDRQIYSIIECLLPDGSEVEFPDYTYFWGDNIYPIDYIENTCFRNMKFYGNFYMNNLKKINDYEFEISVFQGYFRAKKVESVGDYAFRYSVFDGAFNCPNLTSVGQYAFRNSNFTGVFNCPNLTTVGDNAFLNSVFTGDFDCPNLTSVGFNAFYKSVFTGVFECQNLTSVGYDAFRNSVFNGVFNCPNLQTVDYNAFYLSKFTGDFDCPNLQAVGYNAFRNSVFNGVFNCPNLQAVGNNAFLNSLFNGVFNCPNLQAVGYYAFYNSVFTGDFNCPNLTTVGQYAFRNSKFTGAFDCPNLTSVGNDAFKLSTFDTITIGANATLGTGCIGAHSTEFIADYAANNKKAGTYVWDSNTQHWIYQN